jgi:hypothetical protein
MEPEKVVQEMKEVFDATVRGFGPECAFAANIIVQECFAPGMLVLVGCGKTVPSPACIAFHVGEVLSDMVRNGTVASKEVTVLLEGFNTLVREEMVTKGPEDTTNTMHVILDKALAMSEELGIAFTG